MVSFDTSKDFKIFPKTGIWGNSKNWNTIPLRKDYKPLFLGITKIKEYYELPLYKLWSLTEPYPKWMPSTVYLSFNFDRRPFWTRLAFTHVQFSRVRCDMIQKFAGIFFSLNSLFFPPAVKKVALKIKGLWSKCKSTPKIGSSWYYTYSVINSTPKGFYSTPSYTQYPDFWPNFKTLQCTKITFFGNINVVRSEFIIIFYLLTSLEGGVGLYGYCMNKYYMVVSGWMLTVVIVIFV